MRACFLRGLTCLLQCRERALVPAKAANMPTYRGPAVTRQVRIAWLVGASSTVLTELCARVQHARVQRVEQRTSARLRMITEMNANGPQFRGFRDA